jgi:16S rRNA (adenine1518-N6/adenine1519-N6)-dimethyltransferase
LSKKLKIIHGDILEIDLAQIGLADGKFKVIANIPYYITGLIIRRFLSGNCQPSLMVLLVQKEVADRIVSKDSKESLLSMSVKVFGEPKFIQIVKAGSFNPPPKVDSAILLIDKISRKNFGDDFANREKTFFEIVKAGFAHRRKTLRSNLKNIVIEKHFIQWIEQNNLDERIRAEVVSLAQWLNLLEIVL